MFLVLQTPSSAVQSCLLLIPKTQVSSQERSNAVGFAVDTFTDAITNVPKRKLQLIASCGSHVEEAAIEMS